MPNLPVMPAQTFRALDCSSLCVDHITSTNICCASGKLRSMRAPEPPADADAALDAVGHRLRGLRHTHAMTLADLAHGTGISQSTLSRIESGTRRPSLQILLLLAKAYRLTLDEVVGAPATGDPRIHARPSVRYGMTGFH